MYGSQISKGHGLLASAVKSQFPYTLLNNEMATQAEIPKGKV